MKFKAYTGVGKTTTPKIQQVTVNSDELVYIQVGDMWINLSQHNTKKMIKALKKHRKRVKRLDETAE